MYLDEDMTVWANKMGDGDEEDENKIVHKDVNGNILNDGDSVVLIKDLVVKGANFTAKRGAPVHRISLVWDNADQIEGRVDGRHIVILTQYVKKNKRRSLIDCIKPFKRVVFFWEYIYLVNYMKYFLHIGYNGNELSWMAKTTKCNNGSRNY